MHQNIYTSDFVILLHVSAHPKFWCMKIWIYTLIVNTLYSNIRNKVKESRNRPGVARRVPEGLGSQISWYLAREGGEVVSLMHRPH